MIPLAPSAQARIWSSLRKAGPNPPFVNGFSSLIHSPRVSGSLVSGSLAVAQLVTVVPEMLSWPNETSCQ